MTCFRLGNNELRVKCVLYQLHGSAIERDMPSQHMQGFWHFYNEKS